MLACWSEQQYHFAKAKIMWLHSSNLTPYLQTSKEMGRVHVSCNIGAGGFGSYSLWALHARTCCILLAATPFLLRVWSVKVDLHVKSVCTSMCETLHHHPSPVTFRAPPPNIQLGANPMHDITSAP